MMRKNGARIVLIKDVPIDTMSWNILMISDVDIQNVIALNL
jgi:hypothetical protein